MLTGRFRQFSLERLRYVIDISSWLASGELISSLEALEVDELAIEELAPLPPAFTAYQFMVSGGVAGRIHDVQIRVVTNQGQRRVDRLQFIMEGAG